MGVDHLSGTLFSSVERAGAAFLELCGFDATTLLTDNSEVDSFSQVHRIGETADRVEIAVRNDPSNGVSTNLRRSFGEEKVRLELRAMAFEAGLSSPHLLVTRFHTLDRKVYDLSARLPFSQPWIEPELLLMGRGGRDAPRSFVRCWLGPDGLIPDCHAFEGGVLLRSGQEFTASRVIVEAEGIGDLRLIGQRVTPMLQAGSVEEVTVGIPYGRAWFAEEAIEQGGRTLAREVQKVDLIAAAEEVAESMVVSVAGKPARVNGWGLRVFKSLKAGGVRSLAELGIAVGLALVVGFSISKSSAVA